MPVDGTVICPACGFNKARVTVWPLHCLCGATVCEDGSWDSRGLGDTIKKWTTAVGIDPCGGCEDRQKALNKLVPYKQSGN